MLPPVKVAIGDLTAKPYRPRVFMELFDQVLTDVDLAARPSFIHANNRAEWHLVLGHGLRVGAGVFLAEAEANAGHQRWRFPVVLPNDLKGVFWRASQARQRL